MFVEAGGPCGAPQSGILHVCNKTQGYKLHQTQIEEQ